MIITNHAKQIKEIKETNIESINKVNKDLVDYYLHSDDDIVVELINSKELIDEYLVEQFHDTFYPILDEALNNLVFVYSKEDKKLYYSDIIKIYFNTLKDNCEIQDIVFLKLAYIHIITQIELELNILFFDNFKIFEKGFIRQHKDNLNDIIKGVKAIYLHKDKFTLASRRYLVIDNNIAKCIPKDYIILYTLDRFIGLEHESAVYIVNEKGEFILYDDIDNKYKEECNKIKMLYDFILTKEVKKLLYNDFNN